MYEQRASSTPPTFWNTGWKKGIAFKRPRSTPPPNDDTVYFLPLALPDGTLVDKDEIPLDPMVEQIQRSLYNARTAWPATRYNNQTG